MIVQLTFSQVWTEIKKQVKTVVFVLFLSPGVAILYLKSL